MLPPLRGTAKPGIACGSLRGCGRFGNPLEYGAAIRTWRRRAQAADGLLSFCGDYLPATGLCVAVAGHAAEGGWFGDGYILGLKARRNQRQESGDA
jgi:hypothetical protein